MSVCKKCGGIGKIYFVDEYLKRNDKDYINSEIECGDCNGIGESENVMEKLCRENQEPEYYIKTTTGEADGLNEASGNIALLYAQTGQIGACHKAINDLVKQARQDALEDVMTMLLEYEELIGYDKEISITTIKEQITKLKAR